MKILKKYWIPIVIASVLFAAFLFTRLFQLTILPIFTDEAIYIRWSQIGSRDANWRFISLTDGKQPLYTWILMGLLRLIEDPLFAGRFVSVLAGIGSLFGIVVLSWELLRNKWVSILVGALYILSPFSLMYDRLALYDSLVAMFSIWSLYCAIVLVKNPRLDRAFILGFVLGAGMLNKTSAFLSMYLLPFTLLLFDWKKTNLSKRLLRWLGYIVVACLTSQVMYSVLRLSPFFHMIGQKDLVFVYSIYEWISHPLRFFNGNIRGLLDWMNGYLTPPIFLAALATIFTLKTYTRIKILLFLWWILPFGALAMFGRVLYPRFILFMSMPLLILAALSLVQSFALLKTRSKWVLTIILICLPLVYTDYMILTNPTYAPIPDSDRGQLIDDWPAGGGVQEVIEILRKEANDKPISVYTEGTFGLFPYALEIYLVDHPNIKIHGIWPLPADMPSEMVTDLSTRTVYFVLNETQQKPESWSMELVFEKQKGRRTDRFLRLYRVFTPLARAL